MGKDGNVLDVVVASFSVGIAVFQSLLCLLERKEGSLL